MADAPATWWSLVEIVCWEAWVTQHIPTVMPECNLYQPAITSSQDNIFGFSQDDSHIDHANVASVVAQTSRADYIIGSSRKGPYTRVTLLNDVKALNAKSVSLPKHNTFLYNQTRGKGVLSRRQEGCHA